MLSYIFGRVLGELAGNAVNYHVEQGRRNRAVAHWHSPLSRLGRCGILSINVSIAVDKILDEVHKAAASDWLIVDGAQPGGNGASTLVTVLGSDSVVVIQAMVSDDLISAVHLGDSAACVLATASDIAFPINIFVCKAESQDPPHEVPGPSGGSIIVTGLPWLAGLLRRSLGASSRPSCIPADVERHVLQAQRRRAIRHTVWSSFAKGLLRDPNWWMIEDLYLDDGTFEPIEMAVAGPTGILALHFPFPGSEAQIAVARACNSSQRLRAYFPDRAVIPVIVTDSTKVDEYGPETDSAGYQIAKIPADTILAFTQAVKLRGVTGHEVGILNTPAPGWSRRAGVGSDGSQTSISYYTR